MTSQDKKRCFWCNHEAVAEHHIFKRSTAPELITDPENVIPLCAACHSLTETNDEFYKALQKITKFKPKNLDLFCRAQANIDALLAGETIEYITPAMADNFLTLQQSSYAFYSDELAKLEQLQAPFYLAMKKENNDLSDKRIELEWRATPDGQRMIECRAKVKSLEKMMSATRSKMKRMSDERYNQFR